MLDLSWRISTSIFSKVDFESTVLFLASDGLNCLDRRNPTGAELVAWGTVTGSEPVTEGLAVTFDVQEWVYPESGESAVAFVADDPAREVAAPTWGQSEETVLVIVSDTGPTQRLAADEGARAVAQWREAGSTRTPAEECDNA